MPPLFALIALACFCAVLVGSQAVHLCHAPDAMTVRQVLRSGLLTPDLSPQRLQPEAEQMMLLQGQTWVLAQQSQARRRAP